MGEKGKEKVEIRGVDGNVDEWTFNIALADNGKPGVSKRDKNIGVQGEGGKESTRDSINVTARGAPETEKKLRPFWHIQMTGRLSLKDKRGAKRDCPKPSFLWERS